MGLFSKIKDDISHGRVKVHVQAPGSIPINEVIPVSVTITSDTSRTINDVKVELKAQAREMGLGNMYAHPGVNGMGLQESRTMYQTVAQVENRESFSLNAGESKTVDLQLFLNGNQGSSAGTGSFTNPGGVLGGVMSAIGSIDHINYVYKIEASVSIQGVDFGPNDSMAIQMLPPSQAEQMSPPPAPSTGDVCATMAG